MDRFENNDSSGAATVLGTVTGSVTYSTLSIESGDDDWYRFTLPRAARAGDQLAVNFTHSLGDIDIVLYTLGLSELGSSAGTGNVEGFDLTGLAAGTYLLRVYGYNNAANPNYSLSFTWSQASVGTPDRFEDNDSAATATLLNNPSGTRTEASLSIEAGDDDWYRFVLPQTGRTNDALSLAFLHGQGDVDVELYRSDGTTWEAQSIGVVDSERISLAGLAAGTYYARVYGYLGVANPSYSLTLVSPPTGAARDAREDNDTPATATVLQPVGGAQTLTALSVEAGDPDYFRLNLLQAGGATDRVNISFVHALGDVDMQLLAADGSTILRSSAGVGDSEEISLSGLAAGSYFVWVYGFAGASNPTYSLTLNLATASAAADRFEPNDTAATPAVLGAINGTRTEANLTLEANDPDWYRFTLGQTGRTGDVARVAFEHLRGDIDIALYDSAGTRLLGSSTSVSNSEEISLAGLAAGTYLLQVYGFGGTANPNYSLTLSATPSSIAADRFDTSAGNNSAQSATDLRTPVGERLETGLTLPVGDRDWFRFTLASTGRAGDELRVNFTHALGDVDLELYDSNGSTLRANSSGVGDSETISLQGLPAGTYLAQVFAFGGASNPNYSLRLNVAPVAVPGDSFEPNDSAAAARDLRTIDGRFTQTGLTLEAADPDWYRFTLVRDGREGDFVRVNFSHAFGDVDLQLLRLDGSTVIGSSTGVGDSEEISLAGVAAGSYLVNVYGFSGASNPAYTLDINAPRATVPRDRREDNDSASTATPLRTVSGTVTEAALSIEAGDVDWFRFTLAQPGRPGDRAQIDFLHTQGDLDLELYTGKNGQELLGWSEGVGNSEVLSLDGLAAGEYWVRVYGFDGVSNPNYTLTVQAQAAAVALRDRFEDNDTAATATNLRSIVGTLREANLSVEAGDADFYRFTLNSAGRSGDQLAVEFSHAAGDLDLQLFRADGSTLVSESTGVGDGETISLAGLAAGTYVARVVGYAGAANANYTLEVRVAATTGLAADAWEPNNTSSNATPVREANAVFRNATLTAGDQDRFAFTLPSAGSGSDRIRIVANSSDVQLAILNAQGSTVWSGVADADGGIQAPLSGLAAGSYQAVVSGRTPTAQATYELDLRAAGSAAAPAAGSWTLLVYVAADNDLERFAVQDINEMEAAAARAGFNIAVLVDRHPGYDATNGNWSDTRRGLIVSDSNRLTISSPLQSIGEIDTGAPANLTSFINWGVQTLPAQRVGLIIWNHGSGPIGGSAIDESSNNSLLTNAEVRQAITASNRPLLDLLAFDACLMAGVEVASELASVATRLVSSQRLVPGEGYEYTGLINRFNAATGRDADTLAAAILDSYNASQNGLETLSNVDLSKVAALEASINTFVAVMRTASAADWAAARTAQSRAVQPTQQSPELVDLVSFMRELKAASNTAAVDNAADAVINAVGAAVLRDVGPAAYGGLSIVFPPTASAWLQLNYSAASQRFLAQTTWDDFLALYFGQRTTLASEPPDAAPLQASDPPKPQRTAATPEPAMGPSQTPDPAPAPATAPPTTTPANTTAPSPVPKDFTESHDLLGLSRALAVDSAATAFDLGTINHDEYLVPDLTIDSATDTDWFRFSLPSQGLDPTLELHALDQTQALSLTVYDERQTVVATGSTGASGTLNLASLLPGRSYTVEVRAAAAGSTARYELVLDGLGRATPTAPLADVSERAGGNNSALKAFQVGDANGLAAVGGLRNLSLDAADAASGANGGDWFQVDAARTVESNINRLAIGDVASGAAGGDLELRAYVRQGDGSLLLLGESRTAGSSREALAITPQVSDVLVQVFSRNGSTTGSYTLFAWNQTGPELLGGATGDTLVDFSNAGVLFRGGPGNDFLDGRSGLDTAAYAATRGASVVAREGTAGGFRVSSTQDGSDSLLNIERLRFADVSVALDLGGAAGNVAKILGVVFGRTAVQDARSVGVGPYHADSGMSGLALSQLALDARLGPQPSHAAVVDLLYANLFGRAPTAAARAEYVTLLERGSFTQASLAWAAAETGVNAVNIQLTGLANSGLDFMPYAGP
jgi:hypothetical protein